eukprot:g81351.t1
MLIFQKLSDTVQSLQRQNKGKISHRCCPHLPAFSGISQVTESCAGISCAATFSELLTTRVSMAGAVKRFVPLMDRVLVKRAVAETKTAGGIILPQSAQSKLNQGKVIAVGDGYRTSEGKILPSLVKVGDTVMLPEYGGTKVDFGGDNEEYTLYRDTDLLGIMKD